jgi:hypothetical protein
VGGKGGWGQGGEMNEALYAHMNNKRKSEKKKKKKKVKKKKRKLNKEVPADGSHSQNTIMHH